MGYDEQKQKFSSFRNRLILDRGRLVLKTIIATVLFQSASAAAHLMTTGMGPVYDGIALKDDPTASGLLGNTAALFVLVALVAAVVLPLKPSWTRIVVRVASSWVTAMGILMIGWYFKT